MRSCAGRAGPRNRPTARGTASGRLAEEAIRVADRGQQSIMKRRAFFKTAALAGLAAPLSVRESAGHVGDHNWDKYDFGLGPAVKDRLYQGPFPQYPPEQLFPGSDVVMATTPSEEVISGFGKGLITYITADMGTAEILGDDKAQAIEELVKLPLGQKLYIRPTWREIQPRRGRLDFPDYWKLTFDLARKYNKQVGFRIQMRAPDYKEEALPDFVLEKVPMVKLEVQPARRAVAQDREDRVPGTALRSPIFSGGLPGTERASGGGIERQSAGRVRGHIHVRLLGRGPHLAVPQQPVPGLRDRRADLDSDVRDPVGALDQDAAGHQHATRFQPGRECRAGRPHHPEPQLAAHRHHFHREHADRGDRQPPTVDGGRPRW